MGDDDKTKGALDVAKSLVEPAYRDAVQPAAREIGKGLETIAKAINLALEPVKGLIWGYETIKEFLSTRVAEKLRDVPPERIKPPAPNVVGPALEALRFTGHEEALREMYANLLASSLDTNTARSAHPSFVDTIRNMSPDEAQIMRLFATRPSFPLVDVKEKKDKGFTLRVANASHIGKEARCEHPILVQAGLDNLCRLGLLEIPHDEYLMGENLYEPIEQEEELQVLKREVEASGRTVVFQRKVIRRTVFGQQFCEACIVEKK